MSVFVQSDVKWRTYGKIFNGVILESDHMRATLNECQTEAGRNNHMK